MNGTLCGVTNNQDYLSVGLKTGYLPRYSSACNVCLGKYNILSSNDNVRRSMTVPKFITTKISGFIISIEFHPPYKLHYSRSNQKIIFYDINSTGHGSYSNLNDLQSCYNNR